MTENPKVLLHVRDAPTFTTPEEKPTLNARTLAAAFWATFFALEWLLLLNVVEATTATVGILVIHFVFAGMLSIHIDATEEKKK